MKLKCISRIHFGITGYDTDLNSGEEKYLVLGEMKVNSVVIMS